MNDEDILKTKVIADLQEIADEYGIHISVSDEKCFIYFTKVEVNFGDPNFQYFIDWGVKKVSLLQASKTFDLVNIESYTRLMCEVIS